MPSPKWCSQSRLTITRAVSGWPGCVSHSANASRRPLVGAPCGRRPGERLRRRRARQHARADLGPGVEVVAAAQDAASWARPAGRTAPGSREGDRFFACLGRDRRVERLGLAPRTRGTLRRSTCSSAGAVGRSSAANLSARYFCTSFRFAGARVEGDPHVLADRGAAASASRLGEQLARELLASVVQRLPQPRDSPRRAPRCARRASASPASAVASSSRRCTCGTHCAGR